MSARTAADRAAVWLGVASPASLIFLVLKRELHFVLIPQAGIAVAIVLGLLAIAGGWLRVRAVVLLAGAGFLAAAIAQVVLQTNGSSLATNSNGSTFGLWLGLGFGLLAVALTRADPTP
ncbi:Rv1678 family membrane protein [Allorhizocola rhizosphaerae]|uniref:Rv1678 family membrane protein n=1 Tax=Allorhizocola rhizosphaerae TaxID=1872709 RepID=UPI000E3DF67A|nr:hypothetical protein [Allorhizocola rhizosphaerae]